MKTSLTCSRECQRQRVNKKLGLLSYGENVMPTNKVGRLHELKVVNDLATLGFDVYSSDFPQQLYDIVIISRKTHKTYIVEVKTGYKNDKGNVTRPIHPHDKYDILAIFVKNTGEIQYYDKSYNILNIKDFL